MPARGQWEEYPPEWTRPPVLQGSTWIGLRSWEVIPLLGNWQDTTRSGEVIPPAWTLESYHTRVEGSSTEIRKMQVQVIFHTCLQRMKVGLKLRGRHMHS